MSITKLSSNGRVVIPVQLREEMGLNPGDEFEVFAVDGEVRLIPLSGIIQFVQNYLETNASHRSLVDELIEERRREV